MFADDMNLADSSDTIEMHVNYWSIETSTYNHFEMCWDTSEFSFKCWNNIAPPLPRPPFNLVFSVPQIVIAIDIQTSNWTLHWWAGERAFFLGENCGLANVTWNRMCPNYFYPGESYEETLIRTTGRETLFDRR